GCDLAGRLAGEFPPRAFDVELKGDTHDDSLPGATRHWHERSLPAHRTAEGGIRLHLWGKRRRDPPPMGAVGRAHVPARGTGRHQRRGARQYCPELCEPGRRCGDQRTLNRIDERIAMVTQQHEAWSYMPRPRFRNALRPTTGGNRDGNPVVSSGSDLSRTRRRW